MKNKLGNNFDSGCPICTGFIGQERDSINIIYETDLITVALNPRYSPHFMRTAIIPKRHLGNDGRYGVTRLTEDEHKEYRKLLIAATDAIVLSSSDLGLHIKKREGHPLVDYLVRPSVHPSGDLFPSFESEVEFMGVLFPNYIDTKIKTNAMPKIAESSPTVLASFPITSEDLTMPPELRKGVVAELQKNFSYESIRVA